ncbi:MAG: hypothetical protein GX222_08880 [Ruminococcaceae bacterium]|nr:hypothetical protein [Oscillospiraceae bacterium]
MAKLNNCPHCGSETVFIENKQGLVPAVFAQCTNCKIQTQPVPSSLDYSAKDRVAEIWNSENAKEWPAWIQPLGAHDAYSKGSKVSHKGKNWISNIDANVWEPGVTGWTEFTGGAA